MCLLDASVTALIVAIITEGKQEYDPEVISVKLIDTIVGMVFNKEKDNDFEQNISLEFPRFGWSTDFLSI